jgi:hypothetical protein
MSNVFGETMPIIYTSDNTPYSLPMAFRFGRVEHFVKEIKSWRDLNNRIQQRVKGFRLNCSYNWEKLTDAQFDDLTSIVNNAGILYLKFSTIPRRFAVRVSGYEHDLENGFYFYDKASISFEGLDLIKNYPHPDLYYVMWPLLGRGVLVRDVNE